jgi:hypothetical protein
MSSVFQPFRRDHVYAQLAEGMTSRRSAEFLPHRGGTSDRFENSLAKVISSTRGTPLEALESAVSSATNHAAKVHALAEKIESTWQRWKVGISETIRADVDIR